MLDSFFPLTPLTSKPSAHSVNCTSKIFLKFHHFKDLWKMEQAVEAQFWGQSNSPHKNKEIK